MHYLPIIKKEIERCLIVVKNVDFIEWIGFLIFQDQKIISLSFFLSLVLLPSFLLFNARLPNAKDDACDKSRKEDNLGYVQGLEVVVKEFSLKGSSEKRRGRWDERD